VNHHLPLEAKRYRLNQTPSLKPSFVEPNDVYSRLPLSFDPPELPEPAQLEVLRAPEHEVPDRLESSVDALSRKLRVAYSTENLPTHFESGAGLVVTGGRLRGTPRISLPAEIELDHRIHNGSWWRIKFPDDWHGPPASLAFELADGTWIGAAAIPRKILAISVAERSYAGGAPRRLAPTRGAASVIYRPTQGWLPDNERRSAIDASEDVIAKLRAGALTGDEAVSVAARIRFDKHVDPMLGVVAAYLYDAVGDRDSIRRLAWFYAKEREPIPFDVALLADLQGRRDHGRLRVVVPPVESRPPRTLDEEHHPEYFCATIEIRDAPVAGGFPWLRQGWALLGAVRLPVSPAIVDIAPTLLPLPFTTLKSEGGQELSRLIEQGEV
jgi:hypothetical protein